jgi:hypothetical protein
MKIKLSQPTTVFVIVAKDKRGFKRGFEKARGGCFYLEYSAALNALRAIEPAYLQQVFTIGEAIIGWPIPQPGETIANLPANWPDSNN